MAEIETHTAIGIKGFWVGRSKTSHKQWQREQKWSQGYGAYGLMLNQDRRSRIRYIKERIKEIKQSIGQQRVSVGILTNKYAAVVDTEPLSRPHFASDKAWLQRNRGYLKSIRKGSH